MCCRTVNNLLANFLERSCRSVGLVSDQSRPHAEIIIVLHSTELFRAQPARAGALYSLGASAGHGEIGAGVSDLKALCERGAGEAETGPATANDTNVERSAPPRRRGVVRPGEPPCARAPPSTAARHLWKPLVSCPCSVRGRSDALPGRASSSTGRVERHRSPLFDFVSRRRLVCRA